MAMARSIGFMAALGAGAILLGLVLTVPRAFAVEDMEDNAGTKGGQAKSCPKGARYSEKKRGCVKTSCGTGQVWSSGVDACLDANSASLTDDDLYVAGRELGQQAHYAEALKLFFRIKNREQARVLSSIGYSTRKLGDVDKGIDYYHQALAHRSRLHQGARISRRGLFAERRRGEGERAAHGDRRPLRRPLRGL